MKKLSLGLAAAMMLNTSFAFAQMTPADVTQIKVQISQEKLEKDRLTRSLEDDALKIQALEDIKTPGLAAHYRQYGEQVLATTTVTTSAATILYILKTTDKYYLTSTSKNPALNSKIMTGGAAVSAASLVGALVSKFSLDHERYDSLKTQFQGLNETQQAELYVKLHEEMFKTGKELTDSEAKIVELKNKL